MRESDQNIREQVEHTDGLIFPGGGLDLHYPNGTLDPYGQKMLVVYEQAKLINDNKRHFPIMAICMGF
jgi:gamma-glutamyl-gamma-aminobutyrate hydrolase PuuD